MYFSSFFMWAHGPIVRTSTFWTWELSSNLMRVDLSGIWRLHIDRGRWYQHTAPLDSDWKSCHEFTKVLWLKFTRRNSSVYGRARTKPEVTVTEDIPRLAFFKLWIAPEDELCHHNYKRVPCGCWITALVGSHTRKRTASNFIKY